MPPKAGKSRARKNLRFAWRVIRLLLGSFGALFVGLGILVFAAYLALPRLVDQERVRAFLVGELERLCRRPVRIRQVILTPQGIKLQGFEIEEADGSGRAMIEGDFALITIKIRPLLDRRLELGNVKLVSPRIRLSRDAAGRWSFADIFTSTRTAPAASLGRFILPMSLAAENTRIEGGSLELDDRLRNTNYRVERFALAVQKFSLEQPFSLALSFDTTSRFKEREVTASVSFQGSVALAALDWPKAWAWAQRLEVKVDGQALRGSGGVTGFPPSSLELELFLPALGAGQWRATVGKDIDLWLPPSRWHLKGEFPQASRFLLERLEAKAGALALAGSGSLDWSGPTPRLEAELSFPELPLALASSYRKFLERYRLRGSLEGRARIAGWREKLLIEDLRLKARGLGAQFTHHKLEGWDAELSAASDFSRVSLAIGRGSVTGFSNVFSDISAKVALAGGDLKIESLALKWGGARLGLKAKVLDWAAPKEVALAGRLERLRWEDAQSLVVGIAAAISTPTAAAVEPEGPKKRWVQVFKLAIPKKFPDSVGRVEIGQVEHKTFSFQNASVLWDIREVTPKLTQVDGDVRVGFGPGRVADIQAVQDAHKFLRIIFLPYIYMHKMNNLSVLSAATAYPKTLDFIRIEGEYGIRQGVVSTRFFHVDSPQLQAYAEGTADFGREKVDMNILTRLTSYRAPLPEWWVDEAGRPAIGFRVRGDLAQPELEPRLSKLAADEIEKKLEEGRSQARTRLQAVEKLRALGEGR